MDRELVKRAQHGDREADEVLGRRAARRLYPIAYRILRDADQADDAVQQALLEAAGFAPPVTIDVPAGIPGLQPYVSWGVRP